MELVVWFIVRIALGFSLAGVLGAAGFFAGWMIWSPALGPSVCIAFRICGATIGAGLGAFLGWLGPEGIRIKVMMSSLALLGGVAGTLGGHFYGVAHATGPGLESRGIPVSTIMGGAVVSDAILILLNVYWFRRRHRRI